MLETAGLPAPILLNVWKHHAGAIRHQITAVIRAGTDSLSRLTAELRVIGTDLMDLYTGTLSPAAIATDLLRQLSSEIEVEPAAYRRWLEGAGGFRLLTMDQDQSRWVLRLGESRERFVHIHPGRGSPQTRRVRANVLRTAILVLAHAGIVGSDPLDVKLIDAVRRELDLPPVGRLATDRGLTEVIQLLRAS